MKRIISLMLVMLMTAGILSSTDLRKAQAAASVVTAWTGVEGDLYHYHKSTKGDGVPIIIMPVHFGPQDLQAGGKLQTASKWAADTILNAEFVKDLKEYIDIYVYLESDSINPVPQQGYVDSFFSKYNKAKELTSKKIGTAPEKMRIIYLGNSDNAGQVGGHAYGGAGTLLSWGKNPDGSGSWEANPPYWAEHEFWGHTFAGFADEYKTDPYWDAAPHIEAPNMYISPDKPGNNDVPWKNFIGFTDEGQSKPHGIYGYDDYNAWRPVDDCYQNSNGNMYVPMYHKWVLYELMMRYAGFYVTLADFCEAKNITLPYPPDAARTPEENLRAAFIEGGTYTLDNDLSVTSGLNVMKSLNLDLNGKKLTINVSGGSGIKIMSGKTLTISDRSAGGTLTVTHSGEGAGINTSSGTLVVNGGTVNATGGDWSAGIGGGTNESNYKVIINGGTVTSKGGINGAGIGGGSSGPSGGTIIITGGTVSATGSNNAADIGPGAGGSNGVNVQTSGTVTAARGSDYIRPAFVDAIPDDPSDPSDPGGAVTVPSDRSSMFIDLTAETINLGDFTVAAYSVNGGAKWTKGGLPADTAKFSKLFDKEMTLWLSDAYNERDIKEGGVVIAKKGVPDSANIVKFPKINARPKANSEKLATYYADGTWKLMTKPTKTAAATAPQAVYEYVKGNATDGKLPSDPTWLLSPENGFNILRKPPKDDKSKNVYYFRSVPSASGGVYTPGSKPFKISPAYYGAATKYKIDYKKEELKLKKGEMYSIDGGNTWLDAEFENNKPVPIDVSGYITSGTDIMVKKAATGSKPRTDIQTIAPVSRATMGDKTLTCANGKITDTAELKKYEILGKDSKGNDKWGNLPKITESKEFEIRLKTDAKFSKDTWTGNAASANGKLVITYDVYDDSGRTPKSGIIKAYIGNVSDFDESGD